MITDVQFTTDLADGDVLGKPIKPMVAPNTPQTTQNKPGTHLASNTVDDTRDSENYAQRPLQGLERAS